MGSTAVAQSARIAAEQYHAAPGLSNSGMKDLLVSPLRFWHLHINPEAPPRQGSPQMEIGSALHCLVIEGQQEFNRRYARELVLEEDASNALVTIEDLRGFLRDKDQKPHGTRKADVIAQVKAFDPAQPIWDELLEAHARVHAGKRILTEPEYIRVVNMACVILREPRVQELLAKGEPEVAIFDVDPDHGVRLKARLDWVGPLGILDLKTFSQKRSNSIDKSVADAIFYEGYYRQAYLYSTMHQRITGGKKPTRFVEVFIESEEPHDVRIKEFRPNDRGAANLYWQRAAVEVRHSCMTYKACLEKFGLNPWIPEQKIEPLVDEDIRQLAY